MALLTVDERKAIFKELGLGAYNKTNIKKLQKKYMLRKSDVDGIYGQDTDNLLRTVYYTKIYTKNFEPEEFRCECGGRYCCGFPSYMKPAELIHIQKIRDRYGKPITITCGLRDKRYNASLGGSVQNSLHLKGQALDFYQSGVTDTLANRKKSIKWIKKQENHHYTYGNGINSNGYSVYAPYMGNALHTDTYDNVKPKHPTLKKSDKGTTTPKPQKKPSTGVQKPSATTSDAKSKPYKVIDVSVWQGYIDWKKVKADGVVGAIIRYADGNTLDSRFAENMKGAKANGLHVGAYIFSRAKTKAGAEKEAKRLYNATLEYEPDMPLYIDLEATGLEKYADTVASAFLEKMDSLGGRGGVYANLNWWNNYLTKTVKNYSSSAFWIAQPNDKITYKKPAIFGMWQYSFSGSVKGINGKVDMDKCYKAYWKTAPATKIGQAAKDYDGKAGDSSGKEVLKSDFKYSSSSTSPFNWTYVFRPKDEAKAEKAASMCEKAIANNNIGYNSHGETAYGKDKAMTKLAKAVDYDLSKIKTKCGLSCGDLICLCNHYAGLSTCYIGSGLQLANELKKNKNFDCLPYKKGMKLRRGDVLITAHSNGKNNHVAMAL